MAVVTPSDLTRAEEAVARSARHLGAHYTPMPIVRRMVRAAIGPLVEGRSPGEILALRVLDPAVGSGRFLRQALKLMADAAGQPDGFREAIARNCLYGVDVHAASVRLARRAVGSDAGVSPRSLNGHVRTADSLVADLPGMLGVGAFDAVVTNPPWISYSGRQAVAIAPDRRRALSQRYEAFARWPTTHGAFLELAASLLAEGGRAALLVPQQVCHLPGYEATREALRRRCALDPPPELLGESCFQGVVQPAAIVHLRQGAATRAPGAIVKPNDPVQQILRRMQEHPCAPPRTFRDPGVHSGNSARFVVHDEPGPGRAPVREGRHVHPFGLDEPDRWLTVEPDLPEGHYCRIGEASAYSGVRILLRQTADRPIAARHTSPTYFRNSVLACAGIEGVDDRALVALLNSAPVAFYHRHVQADSRQRAFPQVKVGHLASLPIPRDLGLLEPLAEALEAVAACQARVRRDVRGRLAEMLACSVEQLNGRRWGAKLASAVDVTALLARRVPEARDRLGQRSVAQEVESAVRAYRDEAARLDGETCARMSELDAAVCRMYALSPSDADYMRQERT